MSKERLAGGLGNYGNVFREGDTVVRPTGPHTPAVTALLEALASTPFPAPVPLGFSADGSQSFRWIAGDVPISPLPPWCLSDEALRSAACLLRSYHDTVAELELPDDLRWAEEFADPHGGSIICHNDVCPANVVFRDGEACALLDFDFAAPGRPLWDLAQMARMWLRLRPAEMDGDGAGLDPFSRIALIARAYGLAEADYQPFVEALVDSYRVGTRFVRARAGLGQAEYVERWNRLGGADGHARILSWLAAQQAMMLAALGSASATVR